MKRLITSTANPQIVEARKLSQRKHRLRQNRFAAEGLQILGRAVEAMASSEGATHVRPVTVYYCEAMFSTDTAPRILSQLCDAGAEPIHVSPQVLETLSDRVLSQGLVAVFEMSPLLRSPDSLLALDERKAEILLVLDRPQYPGNVGTLLRTVDAVGGSGVILIEPAADSFDPRAVRSSMGSLFSVPVSRTKDLAALAGVGSRRLRWVAADATGGRPVWESDALHGTIGLILGNEGEGLQEGLRSLADASVTLPQRGHADSLNVSVAGGILLYEWLRVNPSIR